MTMPQSFSEESDGAFQMASGVGKPSFGFAEHAEIVEGEGHVRVSRPKDLLLNGKRAFIVPPGLSRTFTSGAEGGQVVVTDAEFIVIRPIDASIDPKRASIDGFGLAMPAEPIQETCQCNLIGDDLWVVGVEDFFSQKDRFSGVGDPHGKTSGGMFDPAEIVEEGGSEQRIPAIPLHKNHRLPVIAPSLREARGVLANDAEIVECGCGIDLMMGLCLDREGQRLFQDGFGIGVTALDAKGVTLVVE